MRISLLAPLLLIAVACADGEASAPPIATYDGGELTEAEFRLLAGRSQDASAAVAGAALTEWLAARAEEHGLHEVPRVARGLERIAARPWVEALEDRVRLENEPTDEAVMAYLEEHRHQLEKPRKIRLATIFKRAPATTPEAERAAVQRQLEEIRQRIVDGEDFHDVAKQQSEEVNRYRGGKMGAIPPGKLPARLDAIAFALEVGETSDVIAIRDGFVLLHNGGELPPSTMEEEEAIRRIREAMRRWNHDDAWTALREELLADGAAIADPREIDKADPADVIATIAGDTLTYADVDGLARDGAATAAPTTERLTPFRLAAVVEQFAFQKLAARRARETDVDPDPKALARAAAARTRRLAQAELDRRARLEPIEVSEADARAFFEENARLFTVPTRTEVAVIQLRLDEAETEVLREKTALAHRTAEAIRAGRMTFAEAARQISEHPSAPDGGDLGLKPRRWAAALGPNVLAAFDELEDGEITDPVRQDHLWILRRGATVEGRPLSWEEANASAYWGVENARFNERRARLEAALLDELSETLVVHRVPEIEAPRSPNRPTRKRAAGPAAAAAAVDDG